MTEAVSNVVASKGTVVLKRHLPDLAPVTDAGDAALGKQQIIDAFAETDGNATRAARLLEISRVTLYRACRRLGIDVTATRIQQRTRSTDPGAADR